jgi:hypothetical protein
MCPTFVVTPIFVGFKPEEYSPFIFLDTDEYKKTKEYISYFPVVSANHLGLGNSLN